MQSVRAFYAMTLNFTASSDMAFLKTGTTFYLPRKAQKTQRHTLFGITAALSRPLFVPAAVSGTNLYSDWARNASNPADTTTLYGAALQRYRDVKAAGFNFKGIIWQQGEADARDGRTQAQYTQNMTDHWNNWRTDTGEIIPTSIGVISDALPASPYVNKAQIQAAQRAFANEAILPSVFVADTASTSTFPVQADNVHYTANGYDAVGAEHAKNFV